MFTMGVLNHYFFRTYTFDYGNYNFALYDYSHFRISPMTTFPGNFLQDHFSFTLMYFIPVYWLLNWLTGTYTLILIQNTLILAAAWFTYKLILLKSDNVWLGVGVLLFYFTLLGRYTTFSCDTNIAVMSACFIPVFIYFFETKKYILSAIILILSLFSRENIPIWFVFIFMVLIINHRKERKAVLFSFAGIAVSIVYFIVLFKVFIPSVETAEKQFSLFNYSALGATPGEAFVFVFKHPIETVKLFFVNHLNSNDYNGVKAEFYLVYLVSGGFILLLRPKYLIWFIPIVAQKVLNDNPLRWSIATYYSIEVVTLLPLSVFLTLSTVKNQRLQNILVAIVCTATVATTIYKLNPQNCKMPGAFLPSKEKIYDKHFWTPGFNVGKVNDLLKLIPEKANVSVSDRIFSHLVQRQHISVFPTINDADYIVFSVFDDYFMFSRDRNETERIKIFNSPEWKLIGKEFPFFLFQKNDIHRDINQSVENKIKFITDTLLCNFEQIDSLKKHILFNTGTVADTASYLCSEKALSGSHSLKLVPTNPFGRVVHLDSLNEIDYLEISVWAWPDSGKPNIVASAKNDFYLPSNEENIQVESGWKKIILRFWVPKNIDGSQLSIYLWNSGPEPVYFDNYQIIKKELN